MCSTSSSSTTYPPELEEAEAEWAHESQFYPTDDITGDDMGSHPRV